jgi:hypothetical protein
VLFAVAARPTQLPTRLATALERAHRDRTLGRLELAALSRGEARDLVGEHVDALYEESGGNPFYENLDGAREREPGRLPSGLGAGHAARAPARDP